MAAGRGRTSAGAGSSIGCSGKRDRRDGGHVWFRTETDDDAEQLLEAIVERRPELLTGFRGEWIDLAKEYPLAPADEVERRKIVVERLTAEEREKWIDDRLTELDEAVRRVESE